MTAAKFVRYLPVAIFLALAVMPVALFTVTGPWPGRSVPEFAPDELKARGLEASEVSKVEKSLESVFDLRAAFAPHVLGAACLTRLGLEAGAKGKAVLARLELA